MTGKKRLFILYILSFAIPGVIMLAALAGLKVTPFGDNSLAISDGNALYINYLGYVGRALKGKEDILYSFEKGLGGNMMGSWGWFLLNPFFVLFSFTDITNFMSTYTYVSVLNFCLCGLTMYILLKNLYGHTLGNLIFSTAYALNGFLVANVFQFNFFTGVATLPLMVLGLRRILEDRSPLIYIVSLAYSLLTNFYFGFMLCAASFLIFLTFFIARRNTMIGKTSVAVKYIISSLLAGALSCVVWLPALLSLRGGRLDQSILDAITFKENMPFLEIFSKLFTGANSTAELRNGLPNIFVGILPVVLVILFFMNKHIARQKKTVGAVLLCAYLISFYVNVVNLAMHGGTVTNWFNYRDSFVFCFLLLIVAAEEWKYITDEPDGHIKRAALILVVGALIVFSRSYEYVTGSEVLIDFAILAVMFLAYRMHKKNPVKNPKRTFEMVVLLLVCVNLFLNYDFSTKKIMDWTNSESEYQETVFPASMLVDAIQKGDDGFYRMEIGEQRSGDSGNDPMLYGYNGVGHGGSDERNFVRQKLQQLGVHRFDMRNSYTKGVPAATDSLLGLKYIISKEDLTEEKGYKRLVNVGEWVLYQNPYVLPIALVSDREIEEDELGFDDVFENLNRTWASLTGKDNKLFIEEDDITFSSYNTIDTIETSWENAASIVASRDASVGAFNSISESNSMKNEDSTSNTSAQSSNELTEGTLRERPENTNYIMFTWTASRDGAVYTYNRSGVMEDGGAILPALNYEGYYHKGDTVTGYMPVTTSLVTEFLLQEVAGRFRAAYADADALAELSKVLVDRPSSVGKIRDSHLCGEFTAEANQELVFTIPYDEGWTLTVDGQATEIRQVLGLFMAANVEPGSHNYEMTFMPTGLKMGIVVSLACVLLLIPYLLLDRRRRGRYPVTSISESTDVADLKIEIQAE